MSDVKPRALVADDTDVVRLTIVSILQSGGFDVVEARNGEEALGLFETGNFDFVTSDFEMGLGMNGIALLTQIRRQNSRIPLVLITGTPPDDVGFFLQQKVVLIRKPIFKIRVFLQLVRELLDNASS